MAPDSVGIENDKKGVMHYQTALGKSPINQAYRVEEKRGNRSHVYILQSFGDCVRTVINTETKHKISSMTVDRGRVMGWTDWKPCL